MPHAAAAPLPPREVYRARRAIAPVVQPTPLVRSEALSARLGAEVYHKLELVQETGSFKLRGAANRLAALDPEAARRGVVTVSTGNHGRAVAHAARRLGVPAVVCMSELVPPNKREAIAALGADTRIAGRSQDEAQAEAERLAAADGLTFVSPFDDPWIIAGQGTLGLELIEALPGVDTVLVPLSGGGLVSGVALALKAAAPAVRVVGVTMEQGAAMYESQRAGRPVAVTEAPSLADSLGGGIGLDNRYTFRMVRDLVDDLVLVSEDEIAAAMRFCYREERLVAEGAAVVGIAALLAGRAGAPGETVAVVLSGRNVDMHRFHEVVAGPPAGN